MFDFSYNSVKSRAAAITESTPQVKIFNMSKTAQASYLFLNPSAIKLLNLNKDEYVRVGIDKETKKIIIVPTDFGDGRKISKNPSGSGSIAISKLIEENGIPTQVCQAGYNRNYAKGGLIFTYDMNPDRD